jgi:hypothetical protein
MQYHPSLWCETLSFSDYRKNREWALDLGISQQCPVGYTGLQRYVQQTELILRKPENMVLWKDEDGSTRI